MGKKKRATPEVAGPNYAKSIDRTFRRLGLPDGRTYLGWRTAAVQKVGEAEVDQFDALFDASVSSPKGTSAVAEWCALDFDRARHLHSGWYSAAFLAQTRWLASELGPRLSGQDDPLLVEVGSGMGTVAAALGAALRVPVLALDPMPGSAACALRFAELTGAQVEAHEASVADLPRLLEGRNASAVYGVGVLRYLQPHTHQDRGSYSFVAALDAARRGGGPTNELDALLRAAAGADILALEMTCSDWLTELDTAANTLGYHVEIPRSGTLPVVVTDDQQVMTTIRLSPSQNGVSSLDLLDGYSGYGARTEVRRLDGVAAEVARMRRTDVELLEAAEVAFPDGQLRLEAAGSGREWWVYQSSTQGYRELVASDTSMSATAYLHALLEEYQQAGAQHRQLEVSAERWR